MSENNDDKLKTLLQKYQPKAREAQMGEFNRILARLPPSKPIFGFQWLALASAVAAGIIAFWITVQQPDAVSDVAVLNEQNIADDFDLYMEEWPTMNVGEDYIDLADN